MEGSSYRPQRSIRYHSDCLWSTENADAHKIADTFRSEYVVKHWTCRSRPEGQTNDKLSTERSSLSRRRSPLKIEVPPFEITEYTGAAEEIRLKYRYLDMRRKSIIDKIAFRAEMNKFSRDWFTENGFIEVQTPILLFVSEGSDPHPISIASGKFTHSSGSTTIQNSSRRWTSTGLPVSVMRILEQIVTLVSSIR
jgi:hypothetical protein